MSLVSTVGIDLAKNVFSVHGVDERDVVMMQRTVSRVKFTHLIAQLPPCIIGMEACSGAHEWARQFNAFGHIVNLQAMSHYRSAPPRRRAPSGHRPR